LQQLSCPACVAFAAHQSIVMMRFYRRRAEHSSSADDANGMGVIDYGPVCSTALRENARRQDAAVINCFDACHSSSGVCARSGGAYQKNSSCR
jgi:hypothetical protein